MAYVKKVWQDRTVEKPLTFVLQSNGDGTTTLVPSEGSIIQAGTPLTAANMNNIENGLETLDNDKAPKANPTFTGIVKIPSNSAITGTGVGAANYAFLNFMEADGATRKGFIGDASNANSNMFVKSELGSVILEANAQQLEFTNAGVLLVGGVGVETRGNNANGEFVKFYNGTQLCTHSIFAQAGTGVRTMSGITYSSAFITTPYVFVTWRSIAGKFVDYYVLDPTSTTMGIVFNTGVDVSTSIFTIVAVGRWK